PGCRQRSHAALVWLRRRGQRVRRGRVVRFRQDACLGRYWPELDLADRSPALCLCHPRAQVRRGRNPEVPVPDRDLVLMKTFLLSSYTRPLLVLATAALMAGGAAAQGAKIGAV